MDPVEDAVRRLALQCAEAVAQGVFDALRTAGIHASIEIRNSGRKFHLHIIRESVPPDRYEEARKIAYEAVKRAEARLANLTNFLRKLQ